MAERAVATGRDALIAALWTVAEDGPTETADHLLDSGVVRVIDPADYDQLENAACYWCGVCVGGRCDDCRIGKAERIRAVFGDQ